MNVCADRGCPLSWFLCQREWSWRKTAALGVVLAAIVIGVCYSQGINSIGTLCGIGAGCFVAPLLLKKMREKTITLPVKEGVGYDLNLQKDLIIEAIRTNKTLTWSGKPRFRPGEIAILPGIRIGGLRERENQVVIRLRLWPSDNRWPHQYDIDTFNAPQNKKVYVLTSQGAQVQNSANPSPDSSWMDPCVKAAVSQGHPVLITGISSSDMAREQHLGQIETPSYQWECASKVDAGIILIRYLKHLTATTQSGAPSRLTDDQVRRYVENQLGCVYSDELTYPTLEYPVQITTLLN